MTTYNFMWLSVAVLGVGLVILGIGLMKIGKK